MRKRERGDATMTVGKLAEEKKQKTRRKFNETMISWIGIMEKKRKRGENDRG